MLATHAAQGGEQYATLTLGNLLTLGKRRTAASLGVCVCVHSELENLPYTGTMKLSFVKEAVLYTIPVHYFQHQVIIGQYVHDNWLSFVAIG